MAHETVWSHNYNGFIRQLRAFLLDAPRVVRTDHVNINNLGVSYELAASAGARPAGDILHIAPETSAPLGTYRVTCVVAGANSGYGAAVSRTVTFNTGARTIISDNGDDFTADGFVAGDLIRIRDAATTGNDGVFRIASITTTTHPNDTITLNAADTLAASDAADTVTLNPLGGGAVFEVEEDPAGTPVHRGWLTSAQEFMAKDGDLWLFMRNGGDWAVGDYAEFELELGNFSQQRDIETSVRIDIDATAMTITRKDYDGSWIRDGFAAGEIIELVGTASNDGEYLIDSLTDLVMTLDAGASLTDEDGVTADCIPRLRRTVDFAASGRTITRASGDWALDGFVDGARVEISNAVDAGNNGSFLIDTVTATVITLAAGETLVDETGDVVTITPRTGNLLAWSDFRYGWTLTSQGDFPATNTLNNGELPPVPNADGNYTSEWIAVAPGNDPIGNPQTIYAGWRSLFSGTAFHNVEQRTFDIVSGNGFATQGNPSRPSYLYLAGQTSMETYMAADGEHVRGFMDVNTSVTEWFYAGYLDVHGPASVYPRPLLNGAMGAISTRSRASTDSRVRSFWDGYVEDSDNNLQNPNGSGSLRWIDGGYLSVWAKSIASISASDEYFGVMLWPNLISGDSRLLAILFSVAGWNFTDFQQLNGGRSGLPITLEQTPTTVTPSPNQLVPMLPFVLYQRQPAQNVIGELRGLYFIPGTSRATKETIEANGVTYIVGQDHARTGRQNFCALRMD